MADKVSTQQTEQQESVRKEEDKKAVLARILGQLVEELKLPLTKIRTTVELLDEGNTIPFIARYRKEMTGELDENELRSIEERLQYLRQLEDRKVEVLRLIDEQGKLTEQLQQSITTASKLQELEDLYRPYRQKRKTRASMAKERGLEPLAEWIWKQPKHGSVEEEAMRYVDGEKGVDSVEAAIQGAMDIIAEQLADDAHIRAWIRSYTEERGAIVSEAKDAEQESVYEMYYEYREPVKRLPPHRTLAINRGEREEILKVTLDVPVEGIHKYVTERMVRRATAVEDIFAAIIEDAYKRLIAPSIEREIRGMLTERAEEHAIRIFAVNLRQLLLQPPIKGKVVLGVDPAFRTGCKLSVVDETGKMLEVAVTYPTPPHSKVKEAKAKFKQLIDQYQVGLIVIGNGTASRETEQFVAELLQEIAASHADLQYIIVSEAGASVYSASKLAQTEFPDLDVAERSAISIARRLQDPLAELVKIEPKAIGVGQYQHDVTQKRLDESLGAVVESAVNHVGVDLNTASPALLSYVAGVNQTIARNIVVYREENGKFTNRKQLLKVPRLGAKAYEQCVGFMRISGGENTLDNTPIHPESYAVVDKLFDQLSLQKNAIGTAALHAALQEVQVNKLAEELEVGVPTLRDILDSLQRPGRDRVKNSRHRYSVRMC